MASFSVMLSKTSDALKPFENDIASRCKSAVNFGVMSNLVFSIFQLQRNEKDSVLGTTGLLRPRPAASAEELELTRTNQITSYCGQLQLRRNIS